MSTSSYTLLLLLLAVHGSFQKSSPESLSYKAAVVELAPVQYFNDSGKTMDVNAKKVAECIEVAAKKDADIVVLPELSLSGLLLASRPDVLSQSTLLPDPSLNYAPCTNFSIPVTESLREIACAADTNDIYVVLNVLEYEVCSGVNCPSDGVFLHVSSVSFDREGKIIARYRKAHLVDEFNKIDVKDPIEVSTFDTDFGVTFGHIICYDIMYDEPWLTLTKKLNVTDIIHPSGWFAETPFQTSVQLMSSWAYAMDVNLLSSGFNKVEWGDSGSGIYAGRQGIVTAVMPLFRHEEVLVADVRKKSKITQNTPMPLHNEDRNSGVRNENPEHLSELKLRQRGDSPRLKWRYEKLDTYETKVIDKNGSVVQRLSQNGLDCEFQVNVTDLSPPVTYRSVALDGFHHVGFSKTIGIRICAIVQCANGTIDSCGHVQNSTATFHSIAIEASYVDNQRTLMMPNTLGTDILPLKNWAFNQYESGDRAHTSISLTNSTQNLVTFGIWGRNFETDTFSSTS